TFSTWVTSPQPAAWKCSFRSGYGSSVSSDALSSTSRSCAEFDCSARWCSLRLTARSARCDARPAAAVFVESDGTAVSESWLCSHAFRRLLLQIGGASIAGADRALLATFFVVARRRSACPLAPPQHGGARS